jgi:hypothetical protein
VYPRTPEEPEDNCNVGPGPDDYDDEDIGPGVEPEDIDDEPQPKLVSTAVPPIVSSAILLVQRMTGPEVLTFVRRIQPLIAAAERGAKP